MQQVQKVQIENIPGNRYVVAKDQKVEDFYKDESHIHKQGIGSGVKAEIHKLSNDIFTYFPKGFAGSKNSDFYEFLSLGKIPNIIGSIMLIGLYGFANKSFNSKDANSANGVAKSFGAGVVLYALGKWASKKIAHAAIKATTGVPYLDQRYIDKKIELPEVGQEKGLTRIEYRQTLESMEFPRIDLLREKGKIEHDDQEAEYKKIAEKNGWGKNLNATEQFIVPKLRKLKARTTALENITSYIAAATGVALGSQEAFKKLKIKGLKTTFNSLKTTIPTAFKQLWNGTSKNAITKHYGKVLAIGTLVSTVLTWLIPTIGFKSAPNPIKSKIDTTKEYEVG